MPSIIGIFISPARGSPMIELARVEAMADCGLAGDRYAERKNRRSADYQVTLIEIENIEAFNQRISLHLTADPATLPTHLHKNL